MSLLNGKPPDLSPASDKQISNISSTPSGRNTSSVGSYDNDQETFDTGQDIQADVELP
ncbi:hypothetical protein DL95DRAFT_469967 [Leptodontidium sp. 2 PMI_412]|nr:hypothetical protein DL95DRAFT_469967 [Leptodontidium sp. 2 PMI_412]